MKILLAPDSFKGTMTSLEVIRCLREIALRHFSPLEVVELPIADGGEGTIDSILSAVGGEHREAEVTGPQLRPVKARYGIIHSDTAVIEMAQASGITLLDERERNPMTATTFGTGQVMKAALDEGIRNIIIGIGGSATNDGGIGFAQALGVSFREADGKEAGFGGQQLSKINRIVTDGMDPRIQECSITVICDVLNPLTGPTGATAVFGPQKGATEEMLKELEKGMVHYAALLRDTFHTDIGRMPGAGAAGGLGAALLAYCGGVLKPGIETILELVDFDRLIQDVDLAITGEGRIDGQSAFGKVPVGIAKRCKARNIPVAAIAGSMGENACKTYKYGIGSIMPAVNRDMSLDEAMSRSGELLTDAADRMFRFIKMGMNMSGTKRL